MTHAAAFLSSIALGASAAWLALPILFLVARRRHASPRSTARAIGWAIVLSAALLPLPLLGELVRRVAPRLDLMPLPLPTWAPVGIAPDAADALGAAPMPPLAIAGAIYLGLVALGLTRLVVSLLAVLRILRNAVPADPELSQDAASAAARLGLRRADVRVSRHAPLPFSAALGGDVQVIPSPLLASLGAEERRLLVAHELAHAAAGDARQALGAACIGVLFTGHPGWRWANNSLVLAREMAVDEQIGADDERTYSELLLKVASIPRTRWGAAVAGAGEGLKARIETLLSRPGSPRSRPRARAWAVAILGLCAIGSTLAVFSCGGDDPGARPRDGFDFGGTPSGQPKPQPEEAAEPTSPARGSLTKEDIISGVKAQGSSVGPCLIAARQSGTLAPGTYTMTLDWTIAADGSVGDARLLAPESLAGTEMSVCIERTMNTWHFRASDRAVPIRAFPFGPIQIK